MDDRVFIRHPGEPHRNGYVTRTAYDALWSKKGYVIEGDDQPVQVAVEGGGIGAEITADDVADAWNNAAAPTQDDLNAQLDERAQLRQILTDRGVTGWDGRTGVKKLRQLVEGSE